jgi:hypothetical protein
MKRKRFSIIGMAVLGSAILTVSGVNLNKSLKVSPLPELSRANVEALTGESNGPSIDDCYTSISAQPGETQKKVYECASGTTPTNPKDCPSAKIWLYPGTSGKCYPK